MKKLLVVLAMASAMIGCERIETGHVGLRVGFDKQVSQNELQPGSFNQVFVGDVLEFQVKDVAILVNDMTPLAKDNSTMKDFDAVVIYNVNPGSVSEIYSTKNKSFHHYENGDTYLMYNYIQTAARNAVYIAARKYEALDMNDARQVIEQEVKLTLVKTLTDEHLDNAITISQVLVRSITPADSIVESANNLVKAKNAYKQKEIEVQTAKQEADRIAALNQNKGAIDYMNAMALVNISEAIKDGKVQSIVVPYDFKGIVNVK
jgi:regulator of protease activity HflC (stomatin/prohibitin superfamily)